MTPQVLGAFTPPAVAQTSLFPPNQPSRTQWYVPRTPSEQVPAPLLIQQGAPLSATVPIPEVGGSSHTYQIWRYQTRGADPQSYSALVWSAIIVIPEVPLGAADACDTFLVSADAVAFLVGAEAGALMVGSDPGSFVIGADPGVFLVPGCD